MKDEIKEILNKLETVAGKHTVEVREDGSKIERMSACVVNELRLNNFSSKILLDFITNLQQERDKFKSRNKKAVEIYKNRNTCKYKKERFMKDKSTSDLMYEALTGDDKDVKDR